MNLLLSMRPGKETRADRMRGEFPDISLNVSGAVFLTAQFNGFAAFSNFPAIHTSHDSLFSHSLLSRSSLPKTKNKKKKKSMDWRNRAILALTSTAVLVSSASAGEAFCWFAAPQPEFFLLCALATLVQCLPIPVVPARVGSPTG